MNSQLQTDLLVLKMVVENINASIHQDIVGMYTAMSEMRDDLQDSLRHYKLKCQSGKMNVIGS